jgi:hypothetical protein
VLLSGYEMAFDVDSVVHGGVADRNFCAEQALLKRCILCSAVGSADANSRPGCSSTGRAHAGARCRDRGPLGAYDRESSVTNRSGANAYFFRSLRISFRAACLLRLD